MLRVTLSRSLNCQCGAFTVLVCLTLIHSCRGQHHVIGPSQPIVATVGEDVVLPAHLHPATNALRVTVEWTRPDLSPRFVHVLRQGVKLMGNHPSYEGRTSLFTDELKLGNISLKLSRVRTSDEGRYRCFIPKLDRDSVVQLVVGAASSPEVQVTVNSSGVVLQCQSTGWYPEPEVFWLDAEGNLLSAGPTETVRGPDDLYTVSSRVTVEKRHSNSFTCRVQQNHTNQTREAKIQFPDDFFAGPSGSGSSLPVIIGLTLSIVFVLAAAAVVVWKWRQNKIRKKKHHEDEERRKHPEQELLMGTETDRKQPTEETDTVHNVDEFRAETGLQTETETETGLDKSQEETETEAVTETASLNPVSTNLNNTEDETESVSDDTEKLREERQKDNNQQTEEEEEKIKCAGDETGAQSLTEEDKHGEQQTAERETLRDREEENLKKKLKTKEREEETLEKQVSRYEGQVKYKEKQINEVKQQLEEVERQTEEAERRMRSVNREEEDLKRKKEELQEQLEKFETQLEEMKKSEIVARQKKLKATNEKEEIIMKLKELETQRNQRNQWSLSDAVYAFFAGLMSVTLNEDGGKVN
ncbi:uncharacterized protein [Pagrus major]|uniref:uncharacterized protein n=1 Tax=Pagrus major TaxID=143350 RepID=UPI003CC86C5A